MEHVATDNSPWIPINFLSLPKNKSSIEDSRVIILPVPYDSTTSYRSGSREGPMAILNASRNLEDYDPELNLDISDIGIYTAPLLDPHMEGPSFMMERIYQTVASLASKNKILGLIGGEHSISIGGVKATADLYPQLSVLYLDAHGDLRNEYMGTRWGHASVARRLLEICPIVQVGVRSISSEEHKFITETGVKTHFWEADEVQPSLHNEIIESLAPNVYISVDLDVLDPSIMGAVGTPEPGGMYWHQITSLLRAVSLKRRIVGFDVTELSPEDGPVACSYVAAKLVYKIIGYATSTVLEGE